MHTYILYYINIMLILYYKIAWNDRIGLDIDFNFMNFFQHPFICWKAKIISIADFNYLN